ncbi:SH3 domain-containing protein [Psychromarinibacter sp. C21-152]|uniref:SH3 domain-containing protein n=1 Tax=Psychromarinibacter sediminicola TaxID=3033385 RepID=A0AAE3NTL5_9RHOB|nr:SH3 domain-containing protein [Psychromarinibacter sediminicola]MDF0601424.1 SH3 domain-containing protein [Psychromarinibacter sediminicola]
MRYLLLFAILIGGSATLPMATMPDGSAERPEAPVETAALSVRPETPSAAAVPDASAVQTDVAAGPGMTRAAPGPGTEHTAPGPGTTHAAPLGPLPAPGLVLHLVRAAPFGRLTRVFDGEPAPETGPEVAMAETGAVGLSGMLTAFSAPAAAPRGAPDQTAAPTAPEAAANATAPTPERDGVPLGQANDAYSEPLDPAGDAVGELSLDESGSDPIILAVLADDAGAVSSERRPEDTAAAESPAPKPEATASVETETETETPAPISDRDMLKVTASILNMRAGPSSGHPVVAGLAQGALAEVIGAEKNGWVPVRVPESDKTGWVFARYMAEAGDA